MMLACVATGASAADMPMKAPQQSAYQWSGCYVGVNFGGGASGTNFNSAVDPGTHLLGADPAVVAGSGTGGHGGDGVLAGGQAGCNLQSGLLVVGLEGDFDYFHSNAWFSNNSNTLSDGVTPFTITQSAYDELPGDHPSPARDRGRSKSRLRDGRRGLHQGQLSRKL